MLSVARHKFVFLVILELSSAYDTVNHSLLVSRMEFEMGPTGVVVNWFKSYLAHRIRIVCINGMLSKPSKLAFGLSQRSIVGPSASIFFALLLGKIIKSFGDAIICMHTTYNSITLLILMTPLPLPLQLLFCYHVLMLSKSECIANFLKLNHDKTDFLLPLLHINKYGAGFFAGWGQIHQSL
ncbi:hypothetical protein HOLleu_32828 [Holothuria leucospilota]|uniref:Reverse transcriptase domain-containing protein n=1 Tax=Holothuria leucospilota TaxID=206669 RepID=A0A9Q1GXP3_HOLLE|nr:hypothetical protein HOLleu_32828 [Holothuria leucospilota]